MNDLQAIEKIFKLHGESKQRALMRKLWKRPKRSLPLIKALAVGPYTPSVQRWAVEALGGYPEKVAMPILRQALKNPAMSVRLHAMLAVQKLGNPRLARYLKPLLHDSSGGIRVNALAIVAGMEPSWLPSALTLAKADPKHYVRRLAERLSAR